MDLAAYTCFGAAPFEPSLTRVRGSRAVLAGLNNLRSSLTTGHLRQAPPGCCGWKFVLTDQIAAAGITSISSRHTIQTTARGSALSGEDAVRANRLGGGQT